MYSHNVFPFLFYFKLWVFGPNHPHTLTNLISSEDFCSSKSFGVVKGLELVTVEMKKPKTGPTELLLVRLR